MRRSRRAGWAQTAGAGGLLGAGASGCARPESFAPVTDRGHSILDLFLLAMALSALVLLGVVGLLLYMLFRFRARERAEEPAQTEGNRALEITWTAAPFLLLAVLFGFTVATMRTVTSSAPSPLRVRVIGHQWWWEFLYPDLGVVTANELHVPTDTPLRLEIEAADVIHSFWVPRFGWKMDAIPGKTNVMTMRVAEAGTYDGACTEFCGVQHAWMRIRAVAQPRDQFDAWAAAQSRPASASTAGQGQQIFLSDTCVNCHAVAGTPASGRVGPDLTHFGSRATLGAGVRANTPENLAAWIRNADAIKPGARMPHYTYSDDELQALVEYLEGLK